MDIDLLYAEVLTKLTTENKIAQVSQKLQSATKNDDRVFQLYNVLNDLKAFPKPIIVQKCAVKSTVYRNLGNKNFQNHKDYEAWQYYNLALLHAPVDSVDYIFALANRSAVFLDLKKYKECLNDIEEISNMGFPERLKTKLLKREASCKEALSKSVPKDDNNDILMDSTYSLKGLRNARYPCASDSVDVVYNDQMGHHVIANRDIEVGEMIAQEDPYLMLLLKPQLLFSCSYCLSRIGNLLPCDKCCFSFYCSELCKENAWTYYHKYECPILATLISLKFTKLELLALRTVIKARCEQPDWQSLFSLISEIEKNLHTEYRGCVKVGDKWLYDSQSYAAIHALVSNVEKRSISDIFRKGVTAAVFLHIMMKETEFLKDEKIGMMKRVGGLLLHHVMTVPTNMHGISANAPTAEEKYVNDISLGSAAYAFFSLLNHSCSPNVTRFSRLGTGNMKLIAIRPIKKGMQLFDNYGVHHATENCESRRSTLNFQYKFLCTCEACTGNWPTYHNLEAARNLPIPISEKKVKILSRSAIEKLERGGKDTAMMLYKPLCELITVLDNYAPCIELADCQESLKQCLAICEGLLPYGFTKIIEWDVN